MVRSANDKSEPVAGVSRHSFSCFPRLVGATLLLAPRGDLDCAVLPALTAVRKLISPRLSAVHVDLHSVPFMDSTGVNFLMSLYVDCRRLEIELEISGMRPHQRRLLEFVGHPLFTLCKQGSDHRPTGRIARPGHRKCPPDTTVKK
ncbi:STAS domain-containing protein [Streptomyces sp. NPDC005533]|uniref:STAS domain-containing protein n=1 Tax=Streptomyces sp. NPDC005533 TaxID=3364723 RepID=UPI0036A8A011